MAGRHVQWYTMRDKSNVSFPLCQAPRSCRCSVRPLRQSHKYAAWKDAGIQPTFRRGNHRVLVGLAIVMACFIALIVGAAAQVGDPTIDWRCGDGTDNCPRRAAAQVSPPNYLRDRPRGPACSECPPPPWQVRPPPSCRACVVQPYHGRRDGSLMLDATDRWPLSTAGKRIFSLAAAIWPGAGTFGESDGFADKSGSGTLLDELGRDGEYAPTRGRSLLLS